jgi:hypothetical protein
MVQKGKSTGRKTLKLADSISKQQREVNMF